LMAGIRIEGSFIRAANDGIAHGSIVLIPHYHCENNEVSEFSSLHRNHPARGQGSSLHEGLK